MFYERAGVEGYAYSSFHDSWVRYLYVCVYVSTRELNSGGERFCVGEICGRVDGGVSSTVICFFLCVGGVSGTYNKA